MKRDREPETARVVVAQARFARGRTPDVAYGIELVNDSYEFDAIDVAVRWRLLDPDGRRVAGRAVRLVAVPASTTFYVGGHTRIDPQARVDRISTTVRMTASRKRGVFLPVAADIRLGVDRSSRLRLTGKLTNAYAKPLSATAALYAVIFDATGAIVGGGARGIPPASRGLIPGETADFSLEALVAATPRRPLFAGVSVDP